jgi:hypothetical protein
MNPKILKLAYRAVIFLIAARVSWSPSVYAIPLSVSIAPSATDSEIKTFNEPHWIYVDRSIVVRHENSEPPERHQLFVFIPDVVRKGDIPEFYFDVSTKKNARDDERRGLCLRAAWMGYHVIVLTYPNEISASACAKDDNPNAIEQFRATIIQGGHSKYISVNQSQCIEYRLLKLLQYVSKTRPDENWRQFLNADSTIKWDSIAVGGQGEGAGDAILMAMKYRVARVICLGGPKDFDQKRNVPAPYYKKTFATPKDCFFTLNHYQDSVGDVSAEQVLSNLNALQLNVFGGPVNVDKEAFPYGHTRILMTGDPGVKSAGANSGGSATAHQLTLKEKDAIVLRQIPVWNYMLTETNRANH